MSRYDKFADGMEPMTEPELTPEELAVLMKESLDSFNEENERLEAQKPVLTQERLEAMERHPAGKAVSDTNPSIPRDLKNDIPDQALWVIEQLASQLREANNSVGVPFEEHAELTAKVEEMQGLVDDVLIDRDEMQTLVNDTLMKDHGEWFEFKTEAEHLAFEKGVLAVQEYLLKEGSPFGKKDWEVASGFQITHDEEGTSLRITDRTKVPISRQLSYATYERPIDEVDAALLDGQEILAKAEDFIVKVRNGEAHLPECPMSDPNLPFVQSDNPCICMDVLAEMEDLG